jgi:hypothetical protein
MIDIAASKRLEEVCRAFGYITLIWVQIDINLDFCNLNLRDAYGIRAGWREIPGKG